MPGRLLHAVHDIIQQLMIDIGLGVEPSNGTDWEVYASTEPDTPDNCLTVQQTTGVEIGNVSVDGKVLIHFGFQVRIRADGPTKGGAKANAIWNTLNEDVNWNTVTLDGTLYCIDMITTVGDVLYMGKFRPANRLDLYSVNALVDMKMVS